MRPKKTDKNKKQKHTQKCCTCGEVSSNIYPIKKGKGLQFQCKTCYEAEVIRETRDSFNF